MPFVGLNSKVITNGGADPVLAAGKLRIYNMRFCPYAQRAIIYAALKKLSVEVVNVDIKNKPEWYLKKHYKGQVPTLEHDGKIIIESAVIPEYLDEIYPETRILPADPYQKVQQKLLLSRLNDLASSFFGVIQPDAAARKEKAEALEKSLETAEQLLPGTYYSGTSKPGFADYLFYPNVQRVHWLSIIYPDLPLDLNNFPGTSKYPKLTAWFSKIAAIPEVIESSQPTEDGVGFFKAYVAGKPNFDYAL